MQRVGTMAASVLLGGEQCGLIQLPTVGRQPPVEEAVDPAVDWRVIERMHAEMDAALLRARHLEALSGRERPHALHLERDLGMELQAEGVLAAAEALNRINVVGREQLAAGR